MQNIRLKKIYALVFTIMVGNFCGVLSHNAYSAQSIKNKSKNPQDISSTDPKNISNNSVFFNKNNVNNIVYEVLVNEFLLQSSPKNILNSYLELSDKYHYAWFAERATQIAIDENDFKTANLSVKLWQKYAKPEDNSNLYRTILYINSQIKDFSDTKQLAIKWLENTPKDKIKQEIMIVPNIIDTTNPIIANDIAEILNKYNNLEAKLAQAKILLKAKQNKGIEIINQLQKSYPNNQSILLVWIPTLELEQRIQFLLNYIQNNNKSSIKNLSNLNSNNSSNIQTENNNEDNNFENEVLSVRRANLLLLTTYFASGQFENGIKYGESILADYQDDSDIIFLLAQFYRVQKLPEKAYSTLINLLENNKKLPITMYLFLSDLCKEANKFEQAAYWLEQTDNDEAKIIQSIALLYIQANKFDKAYDFYTILRNKVQENKKEEFDTVLLQLWLTTKQWNYALEILDKLIIKYPQKASLYSLRSDIYLFNNKFDKAENDLIKSLKLGIDNPLTQANAYNSLAYIYASQNKNLDNAYEYANKAINQDASNYAYQDTIGWVLYKQGKLDKARKWIEQSWNTKQDMETGNHLGEILFVLGERDLAKIIWQQAKNLEESNSQSIENLQQTLKKFGIKQ